MFSKEIICSIAKKGGEGGEKKQQTKTGKGGFKCLGKFKKSYEKKRAPSVFGR